MELSLSLSVSFLFLEFPPDLDFLVNKLAKECVISGNGRRCRDSQPVAFAFRSLFLLQSGPRSFLRVEKDDKNGGDAEERQSGGIVNRANRIRFRYFFHVSLSLSLSFLRLSSFIVIFSEKKRDTNRKRNSIDPLVSLARLTIFIRAKANKGKKRGRQSDIKSRFNREANTNGIRYPLEARS